MNRSSGIIPYKVVDGELQFFIGHPGGECNVNSKWAYLKGGIENGEDEMEAAIREFREESGINLDRFKDRLAYLGDVRQNRHKTVSAFSIDMSDICDIDPLNCTSNICDKGWPEIDRYAWFTYKEVVEYSNPKHIPFYNKIKELHYGNNKR